MKRTYMSPQGFIVVVSQVCCVQAQPNSFKPELCSIVSVWFSGGGSVVIYEGPYDDCLTVRDALVREIEGGGG